MAEGNGGIASVEVVATAQLELDEGRTVIHYYVTVLREDQLDLIADRVVQRLYEISKKL